MVCDRIGTGAGGDAWMGMIMNDESAEEKSFRGRDGLARYAKDGARGWVCSVRGRGFAGACLPRLVYEEVCFCVEGAVMARCSERAHVPADGSTPPR